MLRPAVRGVLRLAFGRKGYRVNIGGQGVFRLSPDFAFRGWESFGTRHNSGYAMCIRACEGKSVFIDVGAHVGLYALPVSRVLGPGGQVYAFEPSERTYRYLVKHIAYNDIGNIDHRQMVVGETRKAEVLFYEHVVGSSGLSGLTKRTKRPTDRFSETRRPQISLDEFCEENAVTPDVIKIDVEGAELLVLRGAKNTLSQSMPKVFLSVHPAHLEAMGQSTDELLALLADLDYEARSTDDLPVDDLGSGEYVCTPMIPRYM